MSLLTVTVSAFVASCVALTVTRGSNASAGVLNDARDPTCRRLSGGQGPGRREREHHQHRSEGEKICSSHATSCKLLFRLDGSLAEASRAQTRLCVNGSFKTTSDQGDRRP